jgi:two-component system, OmpR family, response regulator VicR
MRGRVHQRTCPENDMVHKGNILYIEDEVATVDLIRTMLEHRGYQVASAYNGADGLVLMRQNKPDLVLLDLQLPDIHGLDLHQQMINEPALADIPVVVITAWMDEAILNRSEDLARVDAYLRKPFAPTELFETLARILQN